MNPLERPHQAEEQHESSKNVTLEGALENLEAQAGETELRVVAQDFRTREAIAQAMAADPENAEVRALNEQLKAASERTVKDLKRIRVAAALAFALTLNSTPNTENTVEGNTQPPASAQMLMDNPKLAETLLEGITLAVEKARAQTDTPDPVLEELALETNTTLEEIQKPNDHRYGKMTLRVAEHVLRALGNAAGLGLGVTAFDILKEVVKTVRTRS